MQLSAHLGIAQHDHPHQHHVDVNSQRLVVVNLIHLETEWDNQPKDCCQSNSMSFFQGRFAIPLIAGLFCRDGE